MKILLLTLVVVMLASFAVFGQARKGVRSESKPSARAGKVLKTVPSPVVFDDEAPPPPPPPRKQAAGLQRSASDVFKDVSIGKWGVAGLSVPDDLTDETVSTTPTKGETTMGTAYVRLWKQPAPFYPSSLEADLTVTTWDADFKAIVPELKPGLATPENMTLLGMIGDMRSKNAAGSFVREAHPLEIDGIEGGFFRADLPSNPDRFIAGWYAHRYFEGKAQRISVTVEGRKDELAKALQIIRSLKLQSAQANTIAKRF
jgi:hypothetical protein